MQETRVLVETRGTTGEETTSYWFDLPIDVAEFEEKLGIGAESGDYRIIEKVLPYALTQLHLLQLSLSLFFPLSSSSSHSHFAHPRPYLRPSHPLESVSYTHLDVYKRQAFD